MFFSLPYITDSPNLYSKSPLTFSFWFQHGIELVPWETGNRGSLLLKVVSGECSIRLRFPVTAPRPPPTPPPPLPYLKVWILHCYSSGVLAIRSTFSLMMLMLMGYWCNLVIEFVLTSVFYVKENMGHYFDVISCTILSSLWTPWCYGSLE